MTTVRDLIKGSMQLLGLVQKSESITGDEAIDGMARLNEMIQSFSNESLVVYARSWETFNLVSGTGSYTIGPSAVFNTSRPMFILSAYVRAQNIDYPLDIIPDDQYALYIMDKSLQTTYPQALSYDNAFPVATIRLWPVPLGGTLHMQSEKVLDSFATLDDDVEFPPGWLRMLRYNLALELAPEYGVSPSPVVVATAVDAKRNIKTAAAKLRPMVWMPDDVFRRYNIYSDIGR